MRKIRKIELAVINITMHPHTPEKYLELITRLGKSRKIISYHGSDAIMLERFSQFKKNAPLDGIRGVFAMFVDIDPMAPVLNIKKGEYITSKDGEITFPVPDFLKPNARIFNFVFFPKGHRLFFSTATDREVTNLSQRNVSPNLLVRSLEQAFKDDIFSEFKNISIHVETQTEQIEQILKIPEIRTLSISVTVPNSDDLSKEEMRIKKRYEILKARKIEQRYVGREGDGVKPDEEMIATMKMARSNGSVHAIGYKEREKIEISTKNHPEKIKGTYDIEQIDTLSAIRNLAEEHLPRYIHRRS